jgi:hypothetical protein
VPLSGKIRGALPVEVFSRWQREVRPMPACPPPSLGRAR